MYQCNCTCQPVQTIRPLPQPTWESWGGYAPVPQATPPAVWEGYAPVPQATPPAIWQGYAPVPTPMLIPQLIPHPTPPATPVAVPSIVEGEENEAMSNATTDHLDDPYTNDLINLHNYAEKVATKAAYPKFKQKLAEGDGKIQQEQDPAKKAKLREETYGEAMAAFYRAKYEAYADVMADGLAEAEAEHKETKKDVKQKRKELRELKHQEAVEKTKAKIAKAKADAANPPG